MQAPGLVLNYDLLEDSCHVTINNILLFYHVRQTDSMLRYRTVIGHRRCNVVKTLNLLTYMTALRWCYLHVWSIIGQTDQNMSLDVVTTG